MKVKKIFIFTFMLIFIFSNITFVYSKDESIKVYIDDELITFDVEPIIENERIMVPMRKIFETLGADIEWDGNTGSINAIKNSKSIKLKIGEKAAKVDNYSVILDTPAIIKDDRTLIPLRFAAEAFGAIVNWDENTNSVHIKTKFEYKPLIDDDFEITYKNVAINVGDSPDKLFEVAGAGDVKIYSNPDSLGYVNHIVSYKDDDKKININIKVNQTKNDMFISLLDVSEYGTKRDIKYGSSRDELIQAYGEPSSRTGTFGQGWIYEYGDKKLFFIFMDGKVESIFIFGKWGL